MRQWGQGAPRGHTWAELMDWVTVYPNTVLLSYCRVGRLSDSGLLPSTLLLSRFYSMITITRATRKYVI